MQDKATLVQMIIEGRPDVTIGEATQWATYLSQLKGCHLYSVASPDVDKEEWLTHRKVGIGGSEISVLLGENQYQSPSQLWLSKVSVEAPNDFKQSEPARWGNLLETVVVTEWAARNNRQWIHIPVILQSDDEPWLLANIDAFALTDDRQSITAIIEVKTTTEYNKELWDTGPLPYNYICQINWYMGITGIGLTELVCLVGGQKLFAHTIPISEELFKEEKEAARKFWVENVMAMVEPQLVAADLDVVKDKPRSEDVPTAIILEEAAINLVEAYCDIRDKISTLDKVKKAISAQMYGLLGTGTKAIVGNRNLTLTFSERATCDYDTLRAKYPAAYAECVRINKSSSLRVSGGKDNGI